MQMPKSGAIKSAHTKGSRGPIKGILPFRLSDERAQIATATAEGITLWSFEESGVSSQRIPASSYAEGDLTRIPLHSFLDSATGHVCLAMNGMDHGSIAVVDVEAEVGPLRMYSLGGHAGYVRALTGCAGDGGYRLISGDEAGNVRVWGVEAQAVQFLFEGRRSPVLALAAYVSMTGEELVASGDGAGVVRVLSLDSGEVKHLLPPASPAIGGVIGLLPYRRLPSGVDMIAATTEHGLQVRRGWET
jgi:WD40 repeat protein